MAVLVKIATDYIDQKSHEEARLPRMRAEGAKVSAGSAGTTASTRFGRGSDCIEARGTGLLPLGAMSSPGGETPIHLYTSSFACVNLKSCGTEGTMRCSTRRQGTASAKAPIGSFDQPGCRCDSAIKVQGFA